MKIEFASDHLHIEKEDHQHFINTINRAAQWETGSKKVTVHLAKRRADGWLEYGIIVSNTIYIGAIQRQPGAESEFHS